MTTEFKKPRLKKKKYYILLWEACTHTHLLHTAQSGKPTILLQFWSNSYASNMLTLIIHALLYWAYYREKGEIVIELSTVIGSWLSGKRYDSRKGLLKLGIKDMFLNFSLEGIVIYLIVILVRLNMIQKTEVQHLKGLL